jgi:hypothetical protein
MLKAIELGSPTPNKTPLPQGSEVGDGAVKKRRKHWWLCVYKCSNGVFGSFLGSKRELDEYLSGSLKYEDREIEADEIIDALLKSVSVRRIKARRLVIIHFVE